MYEVIEETRSLDGAVYQAFGLISPAGRRVSDITLIKHRMTEFVHKLNNGHASEVHLMEHINDFLE